MQTRHFEFRDGSSDKFWRITLDGSSFSVHFGKRGTAGQTQAKDFASPTAAQTAVDKLIREKTGKGYVEVAGSGDAPPANPAAPKPQPAAKPIEPAPAAVAPAPAPLRPALDLAPEDWAWATWRPRTILPRPPAPKFTKEDGLKRLERALGSSPWHSSWDKAALPAAMSREEALFWVAAMSIAHNHWFWDTPSGPQGPYQPDDPSKIVREVSQVDLSSTLSVDHAVLLLSRNNLPTAILLPLYHLFGWDDLLLLLDRLPKHPGGLCGGWDNVFRRTMYLHLTETEMDSLRAGVRRWLPDVRFRQSRCNWVLPLAAQIGGFASELKAGLDALPIPSSDYDQTVGFLFGLDRPQDVIAFAKQKEILLQRPEYIAAWLAHTELSALDYVHESLGNLTKAQGTAGVRAFMQRVHAPHASPVMLRFLERPNPPLAKEWFDAHPRETFFGLLSELTNRDKDTAARALALVQGAAATIDPAERDAAYAKLPEAVQRKLAARDSSPAAVVASNIPEGLQEAFAFASKQKLKLPTWTTTTSLPPLLTAEGRLPEDYVNLLLATLKQGDPRVPHPFVLAARCYVTPDSLDAFATALFEQWRALGMESREKWAMFALGAVGSDRAALHLAPFVRNWPGESKSQAAMLGLDVLRNIGTDTAILQINAIAQKTKFAALKKRAQECMEEIAVDRGLSRDELEDRIVPDCGLDSRGTRIFDFGPRQFELRIGEGLKPVVVAPDGSRKPNLPPVNAKDDAAKAAAATDEWKILKKQVADVAKTQVTRLEQALVTQRRWTAPDFERLLVQHPLMTNLVRLLVWGVYDSGKLSATFRVAEDRTYTSATDDAYALSDQAIVGLPHPLQMPDAEKSAWGELFADYEILPPFAQLTRPVQHLTDKERAGTRMERHTTVALEPVIFGSVLQSRGWLRGEVGDGGSIVEHVKFFPSANLTAVLLHSFMVVGYADVGEKTSPEALYFVPGYFRGSWGHVDRDAQIPLREVDSVIVSEVLTDLDYLASKEKKS
jgi:predicted DNA-binding WGR domain protein